MEKNEFSTYSNTLMHALLGIEYEETTEDSFFWNPTIASFDEFYMPLLRVVTESSSLLYLTSDLLCDTCSVWSPYVVCKQHLMVQMEK